MIRFPSRLLTRSLIGLGEGCLVMALLLGNGAAGRADEVFPEVHKEAITVRVLDGKSGEPLAHAHLTLLGGYDNHDLKLGMWREEELTNQKGEVKLANGLANLPYLQVWVGGHGLCHGSPGKARFNVTRMRNEGLSAPNRCGTFVVEDAPGIFTVFVKGRKPAKDAAAKAKVASGATAAHGTAIVYAPVPLNSVGSLVAAGSAVSAAAGKAMSGAMLVSGGATKMTHGAETDAETGDTVDFPPVSRKATATTTEWTNALGMGTSPIPSPSPVEFWMPGAAPPVTTHRRTTVKQNGQRRKAAKAKAARSAAGGHGDGGKGAAEKAASPPTATTSPSKAAGGDGKQATKAPAVSTAKTNPPATAAKPAAAETGKPAAGVPAKADAGAAGANKGTKPAAGTVAKPAAAAKPGETATSKAGAATGSKADPAAKTDKPAAAHVSKPRAGRAAETKSTKKSAVPAAVACPPSLPQKP